jgi:hypothetical protein
MNDKGMEGYDLQYGKTYTANTAMEIPGQGDYVGVFVNGRVVVVDADRFEKAYQLKYRVWAEDGTYVLMDEEFDPEDYEDKIGAYSDVAVVLPESQLENIEVALGQLVASMRDGTAHETIN